ncbi:MAG: hypothetical protein KGY69_11235 [Bacteroidales bacterium]|nr:hypothetical protein [Bacteroidales bacterium]
MNLLQKIILTVSLLAMATVMFFMPHSSLRHGVFWVLERILIIAFLSIALIIIAGLKKQK